MQQKTNMLFLALHYASLLPFKVDLSDMVHDADIKFLDDLKYDFFIKYLRRVFPLAFFSSASTSSSYSSSSSTTSPEYKDVPAVWVEGMSAPDLTHKIYDNCLLAHAFDSRGEYATYLQLYATMAVSVCKELLKKKCDTLTGKE